MWFFTLTFFPPIWIEDFGNFEGLQSIVNSLSDSAVANDSLKKKKKLFIKINNFGF